jgi:hypothetical protein
LTFEWSESSEESSVPYPARASKICGVADSNKLVSTV